MKLNHHRSESRQLPEDTFLLTELLHARDPGNCTQFKRALKGTTMYQLGLRSWLKTQGSHMGGTSPMLKGWVLPLVWEGDMDQISPQRKGWTLCRSNIDKVRRESREGLALWTLWHWCRLRSLGMWLWLLVFQSSQSPQS